MKILFRFLVLALAFIPYKVLFATTFLANSAQDIIRFRTEVKPGDTVLLASKNWVDTKIEIQFTGNSSKPVIVKPQTVGGVVFTGNSTLNIGGEYTIIEGFAFRHIDTKNTIIQFRIDKNNLAKNCRVTNCVIDDCNPADRLSESNWITLYGKNNRFDHNNIIDKKNLGTTLTVELNDAFNQDNFHRVDHNYFGPRKKGGSNGSEIIRVGNSTFSRTSSRTTIEDNYFDRCSGEVEIISVKSCDNILRRNTFYECEGGLVLRHGNRNTVEENYFFGNNKEHTGGVRIINAGHKIANNFFFQLGGERFRSAMTIMNAVPNSPINRYDQVKDVNIEGNIFIDCKAVEFCAGKDFERTAKPKNVQFTKNVFYNTSGNTTYTVNDDISGINFFKNYSAKKTEPLAAAGFVIAPISYQAISDGWIVNGKKYAAFATLTNTGASGFKKQKDAMSTPAGKNILVLPGDNTLYQQALLANNGDTLTLTGGDYLLSKSIEISKHIVVRGMGYANSRPLVQFTSEQGGFSFFSIENGGSLYLSNIRFNGLSENGVAESFIKTSSGNMIDQYKLFVDACDFLNITDGRKHALKVNKGSFADTIQFTNCLFDNQSGEVISIAAEKEDKGVYNAEHIIFKNCVFNKILMGAIDVYRGGNDESTTGPYFYMDHCTFNEVGNVELCSVVRLIGVQYSNITNCIFNNSGRSGRTVKYEDFGWTKNRISYCNTYQGGKVESFYPNIVGKMMLQVNPVFENISTGDFRLKPGSPLRNKSNDGKELGAIWKDGQLNFK